MAEEAFNPNPIDESRAHAALDDMDRALFKQEFGEAQKFQLKLFPLHHRHFVYRSGDSSDKIEALHFAEQEQEKLQTDFESFFITSGLNVALVDAPKETGEHEDAEDDRVAIVALTIEDDRQFKGWMRIFGRMEDIPVAEGYAFTGIVDVLIKEFNKYYEPEHFEVFQGFLSSVKAISEIMDYLNKKQPKLGVWDDDLDQLKEISKAVDNRYAYEYAQMARAGIVGVPYQEQDRLWWALSLPDDFLAKWEKVVSTCERMSTVAEEPGKEVFADFFKKSVSWVLHRAVDVEKYLDRPEVEASLKLDKIKQVIHRLMMVESVG